MTASRARTFRLRGPIEGRDRTFHLAPGTNRVGSAEVNDVILPVPGVSREHARLEIGPAGARLVDLDSRNGSFVAGRRAQDASVEPGSKLAFGPAQLVLEEVDPGDVELGLRIEVAPGANSGAPPVDRTTASFSGPFEGDWNLLEKMLRGLLAAPKEEKHSLELLARGLDIRGACLLAWPRPGEPLVRAAFGDVSEAWSEEDLQEITAAVEAASGAEVFCRSGIAATGAIWAVVGRPDDPPLAVIAGDGAGPEAERTERLLRLFVGLSALVSSGTESTAPPPRARVADLVFPTGHVGGSSPAVGRLYESIRAQAHSPQAVLVDGETGVGKEHVARILHASSDRASGPFVAVNCAAIPADLLEAEMFGVGEGVATGVRARPGQFQLAHQGTLLLDEIGEMPLALQAKLLRALQEKEIHPLGLPTAKVDVRVIASTNADLVRLVDDGRFRSDLYYRIAGAVIHVPSLRERREDIPLLVEHFVKRFGTQAGKVIRGVSVKALQELVDHPWPGNVRELENEVSRLVQACPEDGVIDSTLRSHESRGRESSPAAPVDTMSLEHHVEEAERRAITLALERADGSQRQAARFLRISRNTLARKMSRLQITG